MTEEECSQADDSPSKKAKAKRDLTLLEKDTLTKIVQHLESHPDKIFAEYCRMTSTVVEKTERRNQDTV